MEEKRLKKEFEGTTPPAVFIGSKLKYPEVNVGILSLQEINEEAWKHNNPNYWSKKNEKIEEIVRLRQGLINSKIKTKVQDVRKNGSEQKILKRIQEVGMATLRADVEIKLKKTPVMKPLRYDKHVMPVGISAKLETLKTLSNLKIPREVERVYEDKDMKSAEAITELYKKGFNEQELTQILSIGITGLGKNRRLVPTRNSITAVDDLLGKRIIKELRDKGTINDYEMHYGGHLGNYYLIMLFPNVWNYELFETQIPQGTTMTDHETYYGRKDYAEETEGGYYAARIALLEYLKKKERQATAILFRITTPEYTTPLGVWICRNSVRKSLESTPEIFQSMEEMLKTAREKILKAFRYDINKLLTSSKILTMIRTQKRITQYFN